MNVDLVVSLAVSAIAYGTPLVLAGPRRAARRALRRPEPRRRGHDADGRGHRRSSCRRRSAARVWPCSSRRSSRPPWPERPMALIHAFLVDHGPGQPDRLRTGADDLRRRRSGSRRTSGRSGRSEAQHGLHQFQRIDVARAEGRAIVGPILFHHDALVYLSWVLVVARRLLPVPHAYRAVRAGGRRIAAPADAMGINVTRLPLRAHDRRRRVRRTGRRRTSRSPSRRSGPTGSPPAPAGSRSRW